MSSASVSKRGWLGPRFPARALRDQSTLNSLITDNYVCWRGGIFPDVTRGSLLTQHESALVVGPSRVRPWSMFECNSWGMLFYCTPIAEEHYHAGWGIHLYEFVGHILLFFHHAAKMLNAVGYTSGPILIEVALSSLVGTPWLFSTQGMPVLFPREGKQLDNNVSFRVPAQSEALQANPDTIAAEVLRYVFWAVNWPAVNEPQVIKGLLESGYSFNTWR